MAAPSTIRSGAIDAREASGGAISLLSPRDGQEGRIDARSRRRRLARSIYTAARRDWLARPTHARADVRQNKARQRCPPGSILSRLFVAAGCVVAARRRKRPRRAHGSLRASFLRFSSARRLALLLPASRERGSSPPRVPRTTRRTAMSSTVKCASDEQLSESWVELVPDPPLAARITPTPFSVTGEREYLRLLREAQRDSTHSSARHSLASSRRDTPRDSPKSPPNSPNTELSTEDELKGVYINYGCNKEGELLEKNTDWIYEWSSRPDQVPPKDWKFKHPLGSKRKTYSIRTAKVGKNGLFSKEVIYTLFFTNLLSLLIGTGLGVLLTRRGLMMSRVAIE